MAAIQGSDALVAVGAMGIRVLVPDHQYVKAPNRPSTRGADRLIHAIKSFSSQALGQIALDLADHARPGIDQA